VGSFTANLLLHQPLKEFRKSVKILFDGVTAMSFVGYFFGSQCSSNAVTYLLFRAPARFHNDVCKWRMVGEIMGRK